MKKLYAHSVEGRHLEEWHLLEDHLQAVAELAGKFASSFNSEDWAWNAGLLHDLGKATNAFQKYLLKSNNLDDSDYDADGSESNHASAGAALTEDRLGKPGRILAYLIAGHHAGLPDWHPEKTGNAALPVRLEEGRKNLGFIPDFAEEYFSKTRKIKSVPDFLKKDPAYYHLWVRMLFSCLVDADYLDTERFLDSGKETQRDVFPTVQSLAEIFINSLNKFESSAPNTPINKLRAQIRQSCEASAQIDKQLFSLTVPTGGGKTLSAMSFAFGHALKHGKKRIIYVIPYTSIIEQTAKILRDILGEENVVEHHSNLDPDRETQHSRLASENWNAPVIVTTNVQFFESLYAARTSRCRKLHNLVNSVVILDEAQLLPPKLLFPCVDMINQLTHFYDVTLLMATATQPALPTLDEVTEIIPAELNLYDQMKRVEIQFPRDLNERSSWSEISDRLKQHEKVLCIVNTRKDCYDLHKLMPEDTIHLSALMCGAHRSKVITDIKQRLKDGKRCVVVSTQLVEAGVDIDFPVVYRALTGLDSIAQAAGRCNREGKLEKMGQVNVFVPPNSPPKGHLLKAEQEMRTLYGLPGFNPDKPESYKRYFENFYSSLNDLGQKFNEPLTKNVNPDFFFQFRSAAMDFNFIDDQIQRPIFVHYGESKKYLDALKFAGPKRDIMRKLQRFTVNISKWIFDKAIAAGLVQEVYDGFWCWIGAYDETVGVNIFDAGWSSQDLII